MLLGNGNYTYTMDGLAANMSQSSDVTIFADGANSAWGSAYDEYGNFVGSASACNGLNHLGVPDYGSVVVSAATIDYYRSTGWTTNAIDFVSGRSGKTLSGSARIFGDTYFGINSTSLYANTFSARSTGYWSGTGWTHIAFPADFTSIGGDPDVLTPVQLSARTETWYPLYDSSQTSIMEQTVNTFRRFTAASGLDSHFSDVKVTSNVSISSYCTNISQSGGVSGYGHIAVGCISGSGLLEFKNVIVSVETGQEGYATSWSATASIASSYSLGNILVAPRHYPFYPQYEVYTFKRGWASLYDLSYRAQAMSYETIVTGKYK